MRGGSAGERCLCQWRPEEPPQQIGRKDWRAGERAGGRACCPSGGEWCGTVAQSGKEAVEEARASGGRGRRRHKAVSASVAIEILSGDRYGGRGGSSTSRAARAARAAAGRGGTDELPTNTSGLERVVE